MVAAETKYGELIVVFIIDRRRENWNSPAPNRERFLRRFRRQLTEKLEDALINNKLRIADDKIKVDVSDFTSIEPLHWDGQYDRFVLYNAWIPGDLKGIERTRKGEGGSSAGNSEEIEDIETIVLNKDEFVDLLFEGLELPDYIKESEASDDQIRYERDGYTNDGPMPLLRIDKSVESSIARQIAIKNSYNRLIKQAKTKTEKELFKKKQKNVPMFEEEDLKYRRINPIITKNKKAVMYCIMDISGSMAYSEDKMLSAKKHFFVLTLFLKKMYKNIDTRFIVHHTSARECNEDEFFNFKETGGTVVSGAIELMSKIDTKEYNDKWNKYAMYIGDGDNWNSDVHATVREITKACRHYLQQFIYIHLYEDVSRNREPGAQWRALSSAAANGVVNLAPRMIEVHENPMRALSDLFKRRPK